MKGKIVKRVLCLALLAWMLVIDCETCLPIFIGAVMEIGE